LPNKIEKVIDVEITEFRRNLPTLRQLALQAQACSVCQSHLSLLSAKIIISWHIR